VRSNHSYYTKTVETKKVPNSRIFIETISNSTAARERATLQLPFFFPFFEVLFSKVAIFKNGSILLSGSEGKKI